MYAKVTWLQTLKIYVCQILSEDHIEQDRVVREHELEVRQFLNTMALFHTRVVMNRETKRRLAL